MFKIVLQIISCNQNSMWDNKIKQKIEALDMKTTIVNEPSSLNLVI
jgi:hypothetical protein